MLRKGIDQYSADQVRQLARRVVFLRHLADEDPAQFARLMEHSEIIELEAGEVLIEKDTYGDAFYALAEGQLAIFPEKRLADTAICELLPGQMVGALSMLNHQPRTATVAVSGLDGAIVFSLAFSAFGELDDFSCMSLRTKLCLFRQVVEHIHSTLRHYERIAPDVTLSRELCTLMEFRGEPGSLDELEHLTELAGGLAWLLDCWNQRVKPQVRMFSQDRLEERIAGLLHSAPSHSAQDKK